MRRRTRAVLMASSVRHSLRAAYRRSRTIPSRARWCSYSHSSRTMVRHRIFHIACAAGKLGSKQVPGEIEQLHAIFCGTAWHRPIGLELLAQRLVAEHGCVRWQLEYACAHEFAHDVANLAVLIGAPVQGRVGITAIDGVIGRGL